MDELQADRELVRALVAYAGTNPAAVARSAGVAVSTINRPFNGTATTRIGRSTLEKLEAAFPEFPGWGEPMGRTISDRQSVRASEPANQRLPSRRRAPELVEVAGIDLNFGLGPAFMDQEVVEHQVERLQFPGSWLRQITTAPADQLYWTRGVGNSMEPTISDGDVILIDRSKIGSTFGDLYWAIAYGQTGMIKRLRPMPDGSVKILSDNPAVPPETAYDGELHVFGRVVAVVKKI